MDSDAFDDLIKTLQGTGIGTERVEQARELPSAKKIIQTLMAGYAEFTTPGPYLGPGMLIIGKKSFTRNLKDWDKPHIVFERLAEPFTIPLQTVDDASNTFSTKCYDMIIGAPSAMGVFPDMVLRFYADSRDWEPYPDADKIGKGDQ